MAGHSKFKNIQHRKGAQDKKRAKIFTKLVREIITAAKAGQSDPGFNPRLRAAILAARAMNLPKERIDRAIQQADSSNDGDNYVEMRYEGFMPGGIAIIVDALTDNKNRTASDVRAAFTKYGGQLGETGSLTFMFDCVGIIQYPISAVSGHDPFELAIQIDANDVEVSDDMCVFYVHKESFGSALEMLQKALNVSPEEAYVGWRAQTNIIIDDFEKAEKLLKFIDVLEDLDDVQRVFGNYELSDTVYQQLMS